MHKKLFIAVIFALSISLSAADVKDTWFNMFFQATAKQLPKGCQLRKEPDMRIIFMDVPLPMKSDVAFDTGKAKAAMIKELKGSADADFIKKAEIILIYNYLTTDNKIHSVVISAKDL
ncbi:MAG: hypothetical protein IKO93_14485 [Lentisphaeria bacterium]|nr:hypothetical protein [Lentisphaeria bacterium]